MRFYISYGVPTLPDQHNDTRDGWLFAEENFDCQADFEFFTIANYSFLRWKDGIRKGDNFWMANGVIIDYDNNDPENMTTVEEIQHFLSEWNVNYIIVNSKSHTNQRHKFHILMPFKSPIWSKDYYSALMHAIMTKLPGEPDGSVVDIARFMGYTPPEKLQVTIMNFADQYIDEMIVPNKIEMKNIQKQYQAYKTKIHEQWKLSPIREWIADDEAIPLIASKAKHIINCPLDFPHTHGRDVNASAYIAYDEKNKNWFLYCSKCSKDHNFNKRFWLRKDYNFVQKLTKYLNENKLRGL